MNNKKLEWQGGRGGKSNQENMSTYKVEPVDEMEPPKQIGISMMPKLVIFNSLMQIGLSALEKSSMH